MKKYIIKLVLFGLFLSNIAFAQWEYGGRLICPGDWSTYDLSVCEDGQGGFILSWKDIREQYNPDVYVQRVDSAGYELWQIDGVPAAINPVGQYLPFVAPDGFGGVFVVWTDLGRIQPNRYSVYAQYIDNLGNRVWPDSGIQIYDDGSHHHARDIVKDNSDGAVLLFDNPATVQRVNPAGDLLFGPNGLRMTEASGFNQLYGSLVRSSDSCFIATWFDGREFGAGPGVYAQKFTENGEILWDPDGIPVAVDTVDTWRDIFKVDSAPGGGLYAIWENSGGDYQGIRMQWVDGQGTGRWGASGLIIGGEGNNDPSIKTSNDGSAIIAWNFRPNTPDQGFVNMIDTTGTYYWSDHIFLGFDVNRIYGITQSLENEFEIAIKRTDLPCRDRIVKYSIVDGFVWGDTGVCYARLDLEASRSKVISDELGGVLIGFKRSIALKVYVNRVYHNGWVAPDTTVGIEENTPHNFEINSINVYPNPFNDKFNATILLKVGVFTEIDLFDLNGRHVSEIYHDRPDSDILIFNIDMGNNGYKSGVYFIKVKQGNNTLSKKVTLLK